MRNAQDNKRVLKKKPCKVCKVDFQPFNTLQVVCGVPCSIKRAEAARERQESRKRREQRKDTRERKKALKTRADWLREAQTAFNAYVRYRDRDENCISCNRPEYEITEQLTGGIWDCGHYLTRGAYPELRFSELNAHKQCKSCNGGAGKYVKKNLTVTQQYRIRLVDKIGEENVEWLEGEQKSQNWSIDEIIEIKQYYKDLLKYEKSYIEG